MTWWNSPLLNRFQFRNGERKYLLKKVARTLLPSSIVDRRRGAFGIPLAKWLQDPAAAPRTTLPGVLMSYRQRTFAERRSDNADHRLFLWSWIAMQAFAFQT